MELATLPSQSSSLHRLPDMVLSDVWRQNAQAVQAGKRIVVNQGGTSSGKTWSVLQLLILAGIYAKTPTLISVVSETLPHLKHGAIRDFEKIMRDVWDEDKYNRTDCVYDFGSAKLEFFSADNPAKVRGPRRDILFVNEINNVKEETFDQLLIRTNLFSVVDYNPVSEFWIHEKLLKNTGDGWAPAHDHVAYVHSTYTDARQFIPQTIVDDIERRKLTDKNWWRVYGLGEVGIAEGLVHSSFSTISEMLDSDKTFFGMDFGFANDQTSLVKCAVQDGALVCDELIYEKGLDNSQIVKRLASLGIRKNQDEIFADSSDPKAIKEIKQSGYNIKPCPKGKDSLKAGIQKVNQFPQTWTTRSINAIKEQRNYRYVQDSTGKFTNVPIDNFNHAMDARRYAVMGKFLVSHGSADRVRLY